jgi:hypothetical protein
MNYNHEKNLQIEESSLSNLDNISQKTTDENKVFFLININIFIYKNNKDRLIKNYRHLKARKRILNR